MDDLTKEKFNNQQKAIDNHETRITYLEKNTAILEKMDYRIGNVEKSILKIDSKLDEKQEEKQKDTGLDNNNPENVYKKTENSRTMKNTKNNKNTNQKITKNKNALPKIQRECTLAFLLNTFSCPHI